MHMMELTDKYFTTDIINMFKDFKLMVARGEWDGGMR